MKELVFSLRDSQAECYGQLMFARTRMEIMRSLARAVNSGADSDVCNHPEHFTLFEVGSFDRQSGQLVAHEGPVFVIGAWELLSTAGVRLAAND